MSEIEQIRAAPGLQRIFLRQKIEEELLGNILPFWMYRVVDRPRGGFYGAVTRDLRSLNEVPRVALICAQILWIFAAAYRTYRRPEYLEMAGRAFRYLRLAFWDEEYGGIFWTVDMWGRPLDTRKTTVAQAMAVYGLAEHHSATGDPNSLQLAKEIFQLIEASIYNPRCHGYSEGSNRTWHVPVWEDERYTSNYGYLSMPTLLHLLEAYTNLLRIWDDSLLRERQRAMIESILTRGLNPATGHLRLSFDTTWRPLTGNISYGHDSMSSWFLVEAAAVQGNRDLQARVREVALGLASAVYKDGIDADGGVRPVTNSVERSWWAQAETLIGMYTAFQLSGEACFAEAAAKIWFYIEDHFIDHVHGDWFKSLALDGTPLPDRYKVGIYEQAYQHPRACMELLRRMR